MKKNLIIAIAFVLIIAHIIPPYNAVFANDEENNCEMSDFTVQTIKENDEKIKGTAQPSQQLEIEYITKNKTETINVDANGKFELKVEEEFLELNDQITLSNEYFKLETKVVSEEVSVALVESAQYVECPVFEKSIEEEGVEEGIIEKDDSLVDKSGEVTKEEMAENNPVSIESIEEEDDIGQNRKSINGVTSDNEIVEEELPDDTPADENRTTEKTVKDDVLKEKKKENEDALEDEGVEKDLDKDKSIKKVEVNSVGEKPGVDRESYNEKNPTGKDTKLNQVVIESSSEKIIKENAIKQDEVDKELFKSRSNYNLFNLPVLSISPYEEYLDVFTNRGTSKNDVKEPLLGNVEIFHDYYLYDVLPEPINIDGEDYYNVEIKYGGEGLVDVDLIGDERALVLYSPELVGKLHQHPNNVASVKSDLVGLNLSGITSLTGELTELTTDLVGEVTNLLDVLIGDLNLGIVRIGVTGIDDLGKAVQNLNNIDVALNQLLYYEDQVEYELVYDSNGQAVGVQVEFSQGLGNHLNGAIDLLETTVNNLVEAVNGIGVTATILGLPIGDALLTPVVNTVTRTLLTPVTTLANQILTEVGNVSNELANVQVLGDTIVGLNLLIDNPANVEGNDAEIYVTGIQDTSLIDLKLLSSGPNVGIIEFDEDIKKPILHSSEIEGNSTDGYTVFGIGEEVGDIVNVTNGDGDVVGTGSIEDGGNFSIAVIGDVVPDETLKVQAIDKAGNESEIIEVIVPDDILQLIRVPNNILFGDIEIKSEEDIFVRKSTDNIIEIKDTRKNENWALTAKASPLSSGNNLLKKALIYKVNGEEKVINETAEIVAENTDENVSSVGTVDTISWNNDEGFEDGILLKINPIEAVANTEYSTTIEWTLTDGPTSDN